MIMMLRGDKGGHLCWGSGTRIFSRSAFIASSQRPCPFAFAAAGEDERFGAAEEAPRGTEPAASDRPWGIALDRIFWMDYDVTTPTWQFGHEFSKKLLKKMANGSIVLHELHVTRIIHIYLLHQSDKYLHSS